MGVMIYSFNLNISPKISFGVLWCDIVTELHACDFVIKRGVICAGPCIFHYLFNPNSWDTFNVPGIVLTLEIKHYTKRMISMPL